MTDVAQTNAAAALRSYNLQPRLGEWEYSRPLVRQKYQSIASRLARIFSATIVAKISINYQAKSSAIKRQSHNIELRPASDNHTRHNMTWHQRPPELLYCTKHCIHKITVVWLLEHWLCSARASIKTIANFWKISWIFQNQSMKMNTLRAKLLYCILIRSDNSCSVFIGSENSCSVFIGFHLQIFDAVKQYWPSTNFNLSFFTS